MIKADYLVIAAIILFFSCHVITNYLIWHTQGVAAQIGIAESVVMQLEANPVARWFFTAGNISLIYTMVIMPGLIGGVWWGIRKQCLKKGDDLTAEAIAVMILMIAFGNFLNDFSILLGVLI